MRNTYKRKKVLAPFCIYVQPLRSYTVTVKNNPMDPLHTKTLPSLIFYSLHFVMTAAARIIRLHRYINYSTVTIAKLLVHHNLPLAAASAAPRGIHATAAVLLRHEVREGWAQVLDRLDPRVLQGLSSS